MLKKILGTLSVLASLALLLWLAPLNQAKSEGVNAKASCKTVLLYFYWDKCKACQNMTPFVNQAEGAFKKEGIKVKRFEVYDPNNKAIVSQFDFKTVPAFFLLGDSNGKTTAMKVQASGKNLKETVLSTASQFRTEQGC
jgi:thiol-disulfide isomerase/thioredoxin